MMIRQGKQPQPLPTPSARADVTAAPLQKRRVGGRPTLDEAKQLTARIIEVATDHFLRFGYQDATFERIAQDVGTSKGALYVRYPEKVSLFSAVCEQLISTLYSEDIVLIDEAMPVRASLSRQGSALLAAAMHPKAYALYDMITRDAPRHPELHRSITSVWEYYVVQMERYFLDRMDRGLLRLREPRRAAEHFTQMVFGPLHVSLIHGTDKPSNAALLQHVEDSVLIFLGGIGRLELE